MKNFKNISKRSAAGLGALCLLSLLFSSCLKDHNTYYNPPAALVTFIQASPDQPALDLYFNSNRVNSYPVYYNTDIDYFRAYAGKRTINLYNQGTLTTVFSDTATLVQNAVYSMFLANKVSNPELVILKDTLNKPASGMAGVRFINLSPDAPAVSLAIQGGSVLTTNKPYKGFSSFIPVAGNTTYTFQILQGTTVLATLSDVNLNNGFLYTIWFHGLVASTNANDKLAADIVANAYFN